MIVRLRLALRVRRPALVPLVLLVTLSLTATTAAATTLVTRPHRVLRTPRAIVQVVVHNDGPAVVVRVQHRASAWAGSDRIALWSPGTTPGSEAAGWHAQVRHGGTRSTSPTYDQGAGLPWRCRERSLTAPASSRWTTLVVPRSCLAGGARLQVRVVTSAGARSQTVTTAPVPQQDRPNILMIMVDDMRADDLQFMPQVQHWFAQGGVSFANSFSPFPLCCPARASILTGEYAHNHRVLGVTAPYGYSSFNDASTYATWLHTAGYHTGYVGKYMNGYGTTPPFGTPAGTPSDQYVPPGWDDFQASVDNGATIDGVHHGGSYTYFDTTLDDNGNGYLNFKGQYQSDAYATLVSDELTTLAASNQPFFQEVSFTAPHTGIGEPPIPAVPTSNVGGGTTQMVAPASAWRVRGMFDSDPRAAQPPGAGWTYPAAANGDPTYQTRPPELRKLRPPNADELAAMTTAYRRRLEALYATDQDIGRIMRSLDRTGELANTYVVFTSDNGYFLGEQYLRQGKIYPYEPSLRTPVLMRGPGIPAGRTRTDPFVSENFAPTFAQMAGATPTSSMDGTSMLDVARRGDRGWTRLILTETGPASAPDSATDGSSVAQADESGTTLVPPDPGPDATRYVLGIRSPRYLYTWRADTNDPATGFEELYDLRSDPQEEVNLVDNSSLGADGRHPVVDPTGTQGIERERQLSLMRLALQEVSHCAGTTPDGKPTTTVAAPCNRVAPPGMG